MRRNILVVLAVLALGGSSQAAVNITQSSVPTVDLAGFHTYTLTASTDDGSQIQGFDFASQPEYGFFGSLNQINFAGGPTIFADFEGICPFGLSCDLGQEVAFFVPEFRIDHSGRLLIRECDLTTVGLLEEPAVWHQCAVRATRDP